MCCRKSLGVLVIEGYLSTCSKFCTACSKGCKCLKKHSARTHRDRHVLTHKRTGERVQPRALGRHCIDNIKASRPSLGAKSKDAGRNVWTHINHDSLGDALLLKICVQQTPRFELFQPEAHVVRLVVGAVWAAVRGQRVEARFSCQRETV